MEITKISIPCQSEQAIKIPKIKLAKKLTRYRKLNIMMHIIKRVCRLILAKSKLSADKSSIIVEMSNVVINPLAGLT